MPINLYTSNRLEILADRLADITRHSGSDPFEPITIVVQSRGMERWLSLALAERLGVWANCRYPFPDRIIQEIVSALLPDLPGDGEYAKNAMAWRVMDLLPRMLQGPDFTPLREYLAAGTSQVRLWQLSERIADAFDRYCTYRPEMMLRWERGVEGGWQPRLWRELVRATPGNHRALLLEALMERLGNGGSAECGGNMPRCINIFGISFLPRFHLEALNGISSAVEINLFFLNPCREYWGDIKTEREQVRLMEKTGRDEDLYYEIGNSLLAGMGRSGRDFLWLLLDLDDGLNPVEEYFEGPDDRSMLGMVQGDVLAMRERGSLLDPPMPFRGDDSIRVASCHGPMREAEALHDYLLSLFQEDPTLEPRDVLVMTPDIETYAPYMEAVFDSAGDEGRRIPYGVTDRSAVGESRTVETFLSLFDCSAGRFTAPEVMRFLECRAVRERFGLGEEDVRRAAEWVREAGIRWGLDATMRASLGLPGTTEHTWRAGLDRLILGYCMEPEGLNLFDGMAPAVAGAFDAAALGAFLDFTDILFRCCGELSRTRDLPGWCRVLRETADLLFDEDEGLDALKEAISALAESGASYMGMVEPVVVAEILRSEMGRELPGKNFITGKLTVCATLPMRSIPFRVICLLGMNDGVFPRNPFVPGFDILAERPRRGDRSVRDEDRYLFLETVISARERLYLSYTGQSAGDNEAIPPSPVVSELLDYLDRAVEAKGGVRPHVLAVHPLQAFSRRYFRGGPLKSYSKQLCRAAAALSIKHDDRRPFFAAPLVPGEEAAVPLGSLVGYFGSPSRALLADRLGLRFPAATAPLEETEPFAIGGLERYGLGNELVRHCSRGADRESLLNWYRAAGALPQGVPGEIVFNELADEAATMAERAARETGGGAMPPFHAEITAAGLRISGVLDSLFDTGQVLVDFGIADPRRRLRAWLLHLFLNCAGAPVPRRTLLVCRDRTLVMGPLDDASALLERLVLLYRRGMTAPLPYHPKTSFALAEALFAGKSEAAALNEARREWKGWSGKDGFHRSGEGEDPYANLCTGGELDFDGEFISISRDVFFPLLEHQAEEER